MSACRDVGYNLYLRIIVTDGPHFVRCYRVWDTKRFLTTLRKVFNYGDSVAIHEISHEQYDKELEGI